MNSEKYMGSMFIKQPSRRQYGFHCKLVMNPSWKQSRDHSGVLCRVARTLSSPSRRNLGRVAARFTERMWPSWWCAIREKCFLKTETKVSYRRPTSWPNCCTEQGQLGLPWRDGMRMLRELARSYLTSPKDLTRVMCRLKRSIAAGHPRAGPGRLLYRHRARVAGKIQEAGVVAEPNDSTSNWTCWQYLAPASARSCWRKSQACHHRQTTADSLTGTDSLRLGGGADPDPASFRTKRQLWA